MSRLNLMFIKIGLLFINENSMTNNNFSWELRFHNIITFHAFQQSVFSLQLLSVLENTLSKLARYDEGSLFSSFLSLTVG